MSSTNPYAARPVAKKVEAVEQEVIPEIEKVPQGTISEVLAWVDEDVDRAQAALDAEKNGAKRVTLISALEDIVNK